MKNGFMRFDLNQPTTNIASADVAFQLQDFANSCRSYVDRFDPIVWFG